MTWVPPVLALILAILFAGILVTSLGWRHPRRPDGGPSLLFLFLLLFPLLWAVAMWTAPVGPLLFETAVLPAILIGVLIMLVIAVLSEPRPSPDTEAVEADVAATVFGVAFWILLLGSIAVVVAGYLI